MLVALALLYGWNMFMRWQWPEWYAQQNQPQQPQPQQQAQPQVAAVPPTTSATNPATGATTAATLTTAPAAPAGWRARGDDAGAGQAVQLGSGAQQDKAFAMGVGLARRGAAIDAITLNQFLRNADEKTTPYTFQEPLRVDGNVRDDTRSVLTRSVTVDGTTIDLSNVAWRLESSDAASARFAVDVLNGEAPVVRVVKTYKLSPRSEDPNSSQGYQLNVAHRVENLTDKPVAVRVNVNGPTAPPRELEREIDQNFIFGYWNEGVVLVVSHILSAEFSKDAAYKEFTKSAKGLPLAWAGTQSAYFNAILRPIPLEAGAPIGKWVAKVYGELLNPYNEKLEEHRVVQRIETDLGAVPAKGAAEAEFEGYFGPKGRKVLKTDYYSAGERQYDRTLVITPTSGIAWLCSICTWQWLINVLVWMLTIFHFVVRDWGLAIICLVLVVRALLHPVTKKSQVHMVKMQKMGPEMEKLKKKYGDDKDALARAQMQFYKEQGMTPVLGCLPMFLQMPIWIALWNSLQSTFELRHAPLLYGFTWIHDLSRPDYLVKFDHAIPLLFGFSLQGINILPVLMGAVFYVQMKLQPKPPTMTPEQEQQQKMMTWMSTLLFPLFLYTGPSGLNLYILTSTAFGILESKVIRDHIKQREALEALGPTIVDAPPPPKGGKKAAAVVEPEKPKGWLQRLQEKAQQIQREADRQRKQR